MQGERLACACPGPFGDEVAVDHVLDQSMRRAAGEPRSVDQGRWGLHAALQMRPHELNHDRDFPRRHLEAQRLTGLEEEAADEVQEAIEFVGGHLGKEPVRRGGSWGHSFQFRHSAAFHRIK